MTRFDLMYICYCIAASFLFLCGPLAASKH
jgi:hypothetical protein